MLRTTEDNAATLALIARYRAQPRRDYAAEARAGLPPNASALDCLRAELHLIQADRAAHHSQPLTRPASPATK